MLYQTMPTLLPTEEELAQRCMAVAEALRELCARLGGGELAMAEFIREVLELESEQVFKAGLVLIASNTLDNWIHFTVRAAKQSAIRESFEFDPGTAAFRAETRLAALGW